MSFGKTLNPASLKYTYQGEWNPNKIYRKNDIVRYMGRSWYSAVENAQGYMGYSTRPDKDREMWKPHGGHQVIRGGWSPHFQYHEGDVVSYQGDWFICEVADPKVGSHPIYKNGALTNEWTRMTAVPRKDTSLYVPHFSNWAPMGWNKYGHPNKAGTTGGQTSFSHAGATLLNHAGDLQAFGRAAQNDYIGFQGGGNYFNRKLNIATPTLWEYLYRSKNGIYNNHPNIVQWNVGFDGLTVLYDNGEIFVASNNDQQQGGFGSHTEGSRHYLQRIGVRDDNTPWTNGISGTILDEFIVKFAGGQHMRTGSGTTAALDSDGNVWTWGENNYGGLGDGSHTSTGTDNGIPTKIPASRFGGAAIVDIFSQIESGINDGTTIFYAIDENGMLWGWGGSNERQGVGWGDNVKFGMPNAISDFGQYGGIREVITGDAAQSGTWIITNDNTLMFSGYTHNTMHDQEIDMSYQRSGETFKPFTNVLHHMHKTRAGRNSSTTDTGYDVFEDCETVWDINGGYRSGFVIKSKTDGLIHAVQGGYFGNVPGAIRALGEGQDGPWSSSLIQHFGSSRPNFPMRIDTLSNQIGILQDVVHIASGGNNDNTDYNLQGLAVLMSDGSCATNSSDNRIHGNGNGDVDANEIGHSPNYRPGEVETHTDTASHTMQVRGGQGSQNNIAVMGMRYDADYNKDRTDYWGMLRLESDGSAWATGHIHRIIEEADIYQFPFGSTTVTAENEDASLFGSFRLK